MTEASDQTFEAALAYDGVVVPRYARHFGERLLAHLRLGPRASVLDLACRTGYPATQVLQLAPDCRVIALDRDARFLELARARAGSELGRRIFFKTGAATELRFGAEVFSHAVCNLLDRVTVDRAAVLGEVWRVLVPGGQTVVTLAAQGSFAEPLDMLREVATRWDLARLAERVEQYAATLPSPAQVQAEFAAAGFQHVTVEPFAFELDYASSYALFSDPVIDVAALAEWRWCAEAAPDPDAVLATVRAAFDTYFESRGFRVAVAGCVASAYKP